MDTFELEKDLRKIKGINDWENINPAIDKLIKKYCRLELVVSDCCAIGQGDDKSICANCKESCEWIDI